MSMVLRLNQGTAESDDLKSSRITKEHGGPHPNPFSENIMIPFTTKNENTFVPIVIYDAMGNRIADVVNQNFEPGYHEANWYGRDSDGNKVTKGMYLYKIKTNDADHLMQGRLVAN